MLNISIFGGVGEVEVFCGKLELSMHTYLIFFFSEIIILSYKELDKNLIKIFLFFFNVKIIEKG